MIGINLMPPELKPKGYILKISRTIKRIILIGFVFFLFSTVILIGAILIISGRLKASIKNQESLRLQIKAYQNTEQNLLLTKDRLTKINQIYGFEDTKEEAEVLGIVLREFPEGVIFKEAELSSDAVIITINFSSSLQLTNFIERLKFHNFQKVELGNLSYSQQKGYEARLSLIK